MLARMRRIRRRVGRGAAISSKRARRLFARPADSVPVFVFGKQRSGTTMLMDVFHARADTEVYNERRHSEVYEDFRIRGFEVVERVIRRSKAPYVCFKPLADSHLAREFVGRFPEAKLVWAYRNYVDTALSSLRKFGHATRAIRLVCADQPGGGWFAEGLSADAVRRLKAVYRPTLSAMDLACLVWWARNRLVFELELEGLPSVYVSKYEDLISDRDAALAALFTFVGMPYDGKAIRRVSGPGARGREHPVLDAEVKRLCDELLVELDARRGYRAGGPVPASASLP